MSTQRAITVKLFTKLPENNQAPVKKLLDFAASQKECEALKALEQLIKMDKMLTAVDENGNNFLHLAVLKNTPSIVKKILDKLGLDASKLCKITNKNGYTPLLLAYQLKETAQLPMIDTLLPLTLDCSIKPLRESLNSEIIIQQCPQAAKNPILMDNLRRGCWAVNASSKGIFVFIHTSRNK